MWLMPNFHRVRAINENDIAPMGIIAFYGLFPLSESDSDVAKNGYRTHFLATSMSLSLCGNGHNETLSMNLHNINPYFLHNIN